MRLWNPSYILNMLAKCLKRLTLGLTTFVLITLMLLLNWHSANARSVNTSLPFKEIQLPTISNSQQHHLSQTNDGRLIVSWVEKDTQNSSLRFAIWHNNAWSLPQTILKVPGKLADPPVVMGLSDGTLVAAWMPYRPNQSDKYAADIFLARSIDKGLTWSEPLKPYGESAKIYDAQMSLAPLSDGKLALVWTDMRFTSHEAGHDKKANRYQLMATVIDKHWQASAEMILDDDVCSCCRVYTDAQGDSLVSVYRDHAANEIRDIAAVAWNPKGLLKRTSVHADQWHIEGCPSNGPAVDLAKRHLAVAWFSAADGKGRVKVGFSKDGGDHFSNPIEVDNNANGYANAVLLDDKSALVAWRARAGANEELRIAKVTQQGLISHQTVLYQGGFPKWPSKYLSLERIKSKVYVAWTDPVQKSVRLMAVSLDKKVKKSRRIK